MEITCADAIIRPPVLQIGDRVALLALSGPCDPEKITPAAAMLESLGLFCTVMDSCRLRRGYLAGTDRERINDLHDAFADPAVKGIFAARGGYGVQRLLPHLDVNLIRNNPKIFAGYSDVTALHIVINQLCGFITFHAPMPVSDWLDKPDTFSLRSYTDSLFNGHTQVFHIKNPVSEPLVTLVPGRACGRLTGGNLSILVSSLGTAYEIDTRGKLLFIEEINEEPYKIDRMLLQLKLAGKFRDCSGILLGRFSPVSLADMKMAVGDLLIPENKPVLGNLCCGHGLPSLTLPLGVRGYMDSVNKIIRIGY
jgi:muramoyltetrapeptide carboxypeptidase